MSAFVAHAEPVQVVFADVDMMGHVNNAIYFTYFETARTHYYVRLAGLKRMEEIDIIVAKATCEFLRGLRFGEQVRVVVWPTHVGTTSFTLAYAIVDPRGRWAAKGETVQVSFDYSKQSKKPIPAALKERLLEELKRGSGLPAPA